MDHLRCAQNSADDANARLLDLLHPVNAVLLHPARHTPATVATARRLAGAYEALRCDVARITNDLAVYRLTHPEASR